MTKSETAYILAKQFTIAEQESFILLEETEKAKQVNDKEEEIYLRQQRKVVRAKMETIEETVKLLGIKDKQWSEAIKKVYLDKSYIVAV